MTAAGSSSWREDRPPDPKSGATPGPSEDVVAVLEPEPPAAVEIFGARIEMARGYVRMLATDGVIRGLIGPRETDRLWTRHVLNCAALADLLPHAAEVVDVGSGAGLPGVVLAIARPDCHVVLLEPLDRRVRFLTEVVVELGLTNCRVVRGRAQDAPQDVRGADVVVSRAVAPLGRLAGWSAGLARTGGTVLALKGSSADEELRRDSADVAAAGLRDAEVIRLGGVAGTTFVVRAERGSDHPRRPARGGKGLPTRRSGGSSRRSG